MSSFSWLQFGPSDEEVKTIEVSGLKAIRHLAFQVPYSGSLGEAKKSVFTVSVNNGAEFNVRMNPNFILEFSDLDIQLVKIKSELEKTKNFLIDVLIEDFSEA